AVQIWHRWIEREEIVELECRCLAVERQRIVAAQRNPIRISNRSHCREPVERTAQHDRKKARVAPFGARELRQIRPGEGGDGGEHKSRACWCVQFGHVLPPRDLCPPASTSATGSNRSATTPAKLLAMSTRCDRPSIHADSSSAKPFGASGRHSRSP